MTELLNLQTLAILRKARSMLPQILQQLVLQAEKGCQYCTDSWSTVTSPLDTRAVHLTSDDLAGKLVS